MPPHLWEQASANGENGERLIRQALSPPRVLASIVEALWHPVSPPADDLVNAADLSPDSARSCIQPDVPLAGCARTTACVSRSSFIIAQNK